MNKKNKLIALSILTSAATISGVASAATSSASMTLNIETPFNIIKTQDLSFGNIFLPGTVGTLVIAPDGTASSTGGVIAPSSGTAAAGFTVSGAASSAYSITLPSSTTITDGNTNLTVDAFAHNAGNNPALDTNGDATFNVGASVTIPPTATAGSYAGTFNVVVDY